VGGRNAPSRPGTEGKQEKQKGNVSPKTVQLKGRRKEKTALGEGGTSENIRRWKG